MLNSLGPLRGFFGRNFGKLVPWPGHASITIFQSVIRTSANNARCSGLNRRSVSHEIDTRRRFACRNGRLPGCLPSMTTSSSRKSPGQRYADNRPMCIGRSRYFVASTSPRSLATGPRSMEKKARRARGDERGGEEQHAPGPAPGEAAPAARNAAGFR